ncbi:MAG: ATP-dependent DNA helicase RecG [Muribaculaceae bacterium]|jgi:ATP-dependent DNA helicase RecG|nr:ATP-dependent DNA helicase RecG [Muribaculaceae bacterium]
MNSILQTDIKFLKGVGPKRAEILGKELGIFSYYDLLYHFPFRYIDKTHIHTIKEISGDMPSIQLKGRFITFAIQGEGARKRLHALFSDGTGNIEIVWFNSVKRMKESLVVGKEYIIFGKPTLFNNRYSISHPEIEDYKPNNEPQGLRGIYTLTDKMRNSNFSSRTFQQLEETLLSSLKNIDETLPKSILDRYKLMGLQEALNNIHKPQSIHALQRAQLRLKFDELFFLQLNILRFAKSRNSRIIGHKFDKIGDFFNNFYNTALPFPLTGAQKRVIKEIRRDVGNGRQMNRLLQGDVGSGKTLVAVMSTLIALDNGYQACIIAPTEILASQHYATVSEMLSKIGVNVALLTGSTKKSEREIIHEQLISGKLNILIGTHAVLEDTVNFHNLGLVVIDEQHRFGVAQRAKMWTKNTTPPHILVMTATPIPRTLAMTVYGDLDVSVIDELPPGRKPVTTVLRFDKQRQNVYRFIGDQLKLGRQIYIVYPLIQENEKLDLQNLEEGYQTIQETFPSYRVCFVHGKMRPAEKEHQMQLFVNHQAHIMVATTVIEVGVNVPNASVMVIENAERFGLAQLHQLRGRVGRGADQSYCILMSQEKLSKDTRHRLKVMTDTNDGFVVAEEDMKLRGPGDMEGTQQSGISFNLKIANLAHDGQIVQLARDAASEIIDEDPTLSSPNNQILARQLSFLFQKQANWSLIS